MTATLLVNLGSHNVKLSWQDGIGERQHWQVPADTSPETVLAALPTATLSVHRLVHGGDVLPTAACWSPSLDQALTALDDIAPLHNPPARRWATACAVRWPQARHVLVPDTGLFRDLPEAVRTLPLPQALRARYGLRQHGYHGLAHAGLLQGLRTVAPQLADGRVITLQLGGGCSATAWHLGRPLDTSMGFTPLAGLVMGTRPGNLDPGVLLYLLRQGMTVDSLDDTLNKSSGLLGLSGRSSDLRELLAANDAASGLAIEQFCLRVRQVIGSQTATLGGLDALVFGGGIGEHQGEVRARIVAPLGCLGISLKDQPTPDLPARLDDGTRPVAVWALPGREEDQMLSQALACLETR